MTEDVKSSAKPLLLGAGAAALIAFVIFVLVPQPEISEVLPDPVDEVVEAPVPADAPAAPEEIAQVPVFDTFRVEPDGLMVIAGRAEPGQVVDVILAGEALDRVTADPSGSFVSLPVAGPSDQPRRLSLLADPEGAAIASTTSYMVAPIAAPVIVAVVPEPEAAPEPQQPEIVVAEAADLVETTDVATAEAPVVEVPEAPVASVADAVIAAPLPPTVLQADEDGVRVVQAAPSLNAPEVDENVALDAITYDPEGEVQLSGRAVGDGAVQVYIDNEPLTASPVTEGGDWRIDLPSIDTGVYTLRIDEVDEQGDVVSRLETPFKREEPEDVAAVLAEETSQDGFEVAVRTVQPGATLWAIAEETLGNGIFYVEVFEANSDLIRDPNLIYPGQIFRMPEMSQ